MSAKQQKHRVHPPTAPHADAPPARPEPPPVCRWATSADAERAGTAAIIRLVIDSRWADASADQGYLRRVLRAVASFVSGSPALLATPAGAVTTEIETPGPNLSSLPTLLSQLQAALGPLDALGGREILLGLDGSTATGALAVQAVAAWQGGRTLSAANVAFKLNPAAGEGDDLFGWRVSEELGLVPTDLAQGRRLRTAAGVVLALVCNDAVAFTERARLHPRLTAARRRVASHLRAQAESRPAPDYVLIATHWQGWTDGGRLTGQSFLSAGEDLAGRTGATVLTTLFAPGDELDRFAGRFAVVGPEADRVATLLVEDASGG